jgi:hypothetical protein
MSAAFIDRNFTAFQFGSRQGVMPWRALLEALMGLEWLRCQVMAGG